MKRISTVSLAIVCICILMNTEAIWAQPDTLWSRTYGGNNSDVGYSVKQTSDGGFIIVGNTKSFGIGDYDVWLIRTDSSGDTIWTRTYGGPDWDMGWSVNETSDDGFIIAATIGFFNDDVWDAWLIRTDSDGDTLWTRTFGDHGSEDGHDAIQTSDGGFLLVGRSPSNDVWLIRTDEFGDTLWSRTYGGNRGDVGYSVQEIANGGYIILGSTDSFGAGETDFWLIRTDENGDSLWTRTYGGISYEWGYSIDLTSDGGFVASGITESFGSGEKDAWLIRTDASGDTLWTRTFGGIENDEVSSVRQTSDGGFILCGVTRSFGSDGYDVWLIRTDTVGNIIWMDTFGGSGTDWGLHAEQTSDGGIIVVGQTGSFGAGSSDVWLIRLASEVVGVNHESNSFPHKFALLQNYPNPFNPVTNIAYQLPISAYVDLSIYNVTGQLVETLVSEQKNAGYHSVIWNVSGIGSGLYFYRIEAEEYSETKKCVILK